MKLLTIALLALTSISGFAQDATPGEYGGTLGRIFKTRDNLNAGKLSSWYEFCVSYNKIQNVRNRLPESLKSQVGLIDRVVNNNDELAKNYCNGGTSKLYGGTIGIVFRESNQLRSGVISSNSEFCPSILDLNEMKYSLIEGLESQRGLIEKVVSENDDLMKKHCMATPSSYGETIGTIFRLRDELRAGNTENSVEFCIKARELRRMKGLLPEGLESQEELIDRVLENNKDLIENYCETKPSDEETRQQHEIDSIDESGSSSRNGATKEVTPIQQDKTESRGSKTIGI